MDTLKLAERLQKLRKENGYSQEQLADELNVSRQAVSKWECGESLPDTENLIALAKLYNCSIDDIVFEEGESAAPVAPANPDAPQMDDDGEGRQLTKREIIIESIVSSATAAVCALVYVLCGILLNVWHPTWIVFFAVIVIPSLVDCIMKREPRVFAFPILVVAVYLMLGCIWNLWHPGWVVFLTIPVYYGLTDGLSRLKNAKK